MTGADETGAPEQRGRGGWTRFAGNLGLAVAALVIALLVCELALRLLGISYPVYVWMDPIRGVVHIPGSRSSNTYNGHSWIEINRDGMRGPDIALQRPPNTYRVALLGDSYIEAFEVPYEKTSGQVLQRQLSKLRGKPVEVLNFGEGGYGTGQELLTLQHQVWKYSPNLVVLALTTGNDISDNYRPLKQTDYVPYFVYQGDSLVLDSSFVQTSGYRSRAFWTREMLTIVKHSRLAQLVNRVRHVRRKDEGRKANAVAAPGDEVGMRDEVQLPPTTPEWQTAWRVTEGLLRMMRDECRRHNTPFAIVTLSRGIQVTPIPERKARFLKQLGAKDLYYPERRLSEFGQREGIPVYSLAPVMAKMADARHVYFHADGDSLGVGHWNEEGNRVAGELMANWIAGGLARQPIPDSPPTPRVP